MANSNRSSPQRFPDLYALLGLRPLESDPDVIASTLRRLAAQVKSTQLADEDQASAARQAKIVELGKHHLLSPARKGRYDQQWRQLHAHQSEGQKLAHTAVNREFAGLLPSGDPTEAFRLDEYSQNAAIQARPAYEADFDKLQELLCPAGERLKQDSGEPSRPGLEDSALRTSRELNQAPKACTPAQGAEAGTPVHDWPVRQRRRQRERRVLWGVISALASLAVILGASYLFKAADPPTVAEGGANAELHVESNSPIDTTQPAAPTQRRSGLPGVAGIAADQDLTNNLDELVPVAPAETLPTEVASGLEPDKMVAGISTELITPEMPMEAGNQPGPNNASEPKLDDAQRMAWATAMHAAKRLIGQRQYAAAKQQLAANEQLAKTSLQQSQLLRLSQINSLAEEFQQALRTAIGGLSAGEVVMIDSSTPVGIVDSAEDRITIRVQGKNQKFLLTELPLGLAFALSDFSMDAELPSTLARKGAFAWVHPAETGSDVAAQRAREMLAAAAAGGAIASDLLQVFTDDYQLTTTSD